MDAAVSLHAAPLPPPHHHHHRALPLRRHSSSSASYSSSSTTAPPKAPAPPAAARLTLAPRPRSPARSASSPALAPATAPAAAVRSSSRAATGYAAALADACASAGTLRRAYRHARALLSRWRRSAPEEEEMDARVVALVRMLVGKGKAGMVPEVLAEFAAICDQLLPLPAPARAHHAY
ncbi:hypothetical protein BAE44_0013042 [Dichanthelium oligosanthes]|uniref:Uncharacterized protein n=1 Tax=Dichanthelium oligosanthes TaxID=888268 RepID=A0A1E5VLD3_9POAL|nr:hypothetical protein BAE44_0013042 [Dichanthelium oligosanthes]